MQAARRKREQMPNTPPEYSVVVPVYQSAQSVIELVERTLAVFDNDLKASVEIILIDDGSDNADTWPTLERLVYQDARVIAVRMMRNFGKPAAVLCGMTYARGQWIVTIDDDLQQSPEDIPALVAQREHDVVVAKYDRKQHSWIVTTTSRIKRLFDAKVLGLKMPMTPLKLIRRRVIDQMLDMRSGRPYIPALLAHVTSDFVAVPLQHHASKAGKSRYNFYRRLRQFSNLVISNSGVFARIWALLGMLSILAGGLAILIASLFAGWSGITLLLVVMLLLGGSILLALAVVGEYLIRLVELTSKRPPYVERTVIGRRDVDKS